MVGNTNAENIEAISVIFTSPIKIEMAEKNTINGSNFFNRPLYHANIVPLCRHTELTNVKPLIQKNILLPISPPNANNDKLAGNTISK